MMGIPFTELAARDPDLKAEQKPRAQAQALRSGFG